MRTLVNVAKAAAFSTLIVMPAAALTPAAAQEATPAAYSCDAPMTGSPMADMPMANMGAMPMMAGTPMAGMGHEDIDRIAALIKSVSANRTVLMVEHNLSVVENLCQRITVLTRGRVLAEGDYQAVSNNPEVREAYMGTGHG